MTTTSKIILAVSVALGMTVSGNAFASQGSRAHMQVTGKTTQPIGHYEYCKQYPSDCALRSADTRPVKLTRARWKQLVEVNDLVNRKVKPVTDQEFYKVEEFWTYPDGYGDCEDYVLLKRYLLMKQGWPSASLLITVVRQHNGDGHAVLTVRTDRADYVLDNLNDQIVEWSDASYHFLKRQAASNSGKWEGIDDTRSSVVGSVKQ
jgi:predicted transglutaminase-like cysteine proteinase